MKNNLLRKLETLKELVADDRGDEVLESALSYLLSYEKAKLDNDLSLTREEIKKFETDYNMSDREFLRLYESGLLEDRHEFLEWFALLSLEVNLRKKIEMVVSLL